jgi:8-oxo-dGTP diphosphatase
MGIGHFLCGVGAVIFDPKTERYLLLRRVEHKDFEAGEWEDLTGRVDQGESFTQALHREVMEEIGCEAQIEFIIGVTHFYRGEDKPENELLGVLFGCTLKNPEAIHLGEEHSEIRWATVEEAGEFLPQHHWLRKVLPMADRLRKLFPEELREEHRKNGFEI